jgi:hypothetical protein
MHASMRFRTPGNAEQRRIAVALTLLERQYARCPRVQRVERHRPPNASAARRQLARRVDAACVNDGSASA